MIYEFIDSKGTFSVKDPHRYNLYFPLTNKDGTLLSSINSNLGGDIKENNSRFLTPPASIVDIKNNLLCRRDFFIKINSAGKFKTNISSENADKKILRLSYPGKDTLEGGFLYHKIIKETNLLRIEILNFVPYDMAVEVMWVRLINKSSRKIEITPTSFIPLYGRGEKNLRDHRHVSSLLNRIHLTKYGIFLKPTLVFDEKGHSKNETVYFCLGFEGEAKPPLGQFPTLDYFCGRGDLINPSAIEKNVAPVTKNRSEFEGKEATAAFRFKTRNLKEKEEVNYFLIMGINSSPGKKSRQKIMDTFYKLNSPSKIRQSLEETKKYWLDCLSRINFDFKNKNFNNWLLWVKMQPTLRKLFGCSFLPHFDYGKGGRGWRDIWQDTLTLLLNEPDKAKKLMLNSFKGVRIDGTNATIITKKGKLISDRNSINRVWMDHGVWPYLSLCLYINKTGDLSILNKDIAYFRDHLLKRTKEVDFKFCQKDYFLRTKNNNIYKGSILEHILVQHLVSFFNVGKHNIIRLENADWNDALDMAPEKGESAAFSFMYAHNLGNLCFFLKKLKKKTGKVTLLKELLLLLDRAGTPLPSSARQGPASLKNNPVNPVREFSLTPVSSKTFSNGVNYNDFREKQKRLQEYLEVSKNISGEKIEIEIDNLIYDLEEKSRHLSAWLRKKEWLKNGFFNGYYDNKGKRVEGASGGKTKMMLTSQVFAIMSETAADNQIEKIWSSIKKHLKDNKTGGFRLNTDFDSLYLDLGRAFGFSYGDKENGAFFSHMTVMLAYALYERGFIKEGSETINSIYKMAAAKEAEIYPMIPEYFNNKGRGLYLYLTGSASWYIYTLIEKILGIKFILGDIILEPKLTSSDFFKNTIEFIWHLEEKRIKISFIRPEKRKENEFYKTKKAFLEGKEISKVDNKYIVKKEEITKAKGKEISLKVYLQ